MGVEFGIWRVDGGLQKLAPSGIDYERRLEDLLARDITLAAPHLMVIGRQVRTTHDTLIDLLAIDKAGNLAVLELKRDKTYRDIVAQVLDYGAWVQGLRDDDIARIFEDYQSRFDSEADSRSIDEAFCQRFQVASTPDELNAAHALYIVAAELDPATERVVDYLAEAYGLDINAIFFQFVRDGEREYLCRAWLREPTVQAEAPTQRRGGEWNGEYYVSFGQGQRRDWEEARRWGFISAGGGTWYSNTLAMLSEGARIWVNVPGTGYVGVGLVQGPRMPLNEFTVTRDDGTTVPIVEESERLAALAPECPNTDECEYLVPVRWVHAVPLAEAVKEKGFFGNQNSVAKPVAASWPHTVERLKRRFGLQE